MYLSPHSGARISRTWKDYTLHKPRAICIPNIEMMDYLADKHGLEFS